MEAKLKTVIELLKTNGVRYADARYVARTKENIQVKGQSAELIARERDCGVGVRVLRRGAWGFSATSDLSESALANTAMDALRIAKASASANSEKVKLAPQEPHIAEWRGECAKDPFAVPTEEKLALLFKATKTLSADPKIKVAEGSMNFTQTETLFVSADGACIRQTKTNSGAGIYATAIENGEFQKRSYPASHGGNFASRGYEFIEEMDLAGNAEKTREEALALLLAPKCPTGKLDLIIGSAQMVLQVHESCGHPIELDRVLGTEISLAGASFLTTDKWRNFEYGSKPVNITADATIEGALGSFGFDDEGVPSQRTPIVKDGKFVNYLTSRETAKVLGLKSNGAMRADGWSAIPLIRMVNINLEPGDADLDAVIADTKDGVLVDTNKSWSIDDLRINFQFGCEIGWRILNGKIAGVVKNPVYTGITPLFWRSCDAVCSAKHYKMWGIPSCGKGEPMQTMQVGHGTVPARFRGVELL